ncbi:NAD(P)/FAD-dependent oxidoreductase [Rhizobium johnstonii]|uniref:NAD(P)/FAD-dependent oxidoreductase n=1 Tax=Rhizobium TaxID=379 RepID=UPI00140FE326|nr:FAD-binding oxidoreductase [Rhizobium leguminosarum]QIO64028.1 FAD-binding oxidoreductase [Rhizobium leguminosarum bv. trifolii]
MSDTQISNEPYWWMAAPPATEETSPLPKLADVAIIGAGYTGLSAAITLSRAGRSVVVLDKLLPGEGASSRNGGITSGNLRLSNSALARRFGQIRADAIVKESKNARDDLYKFIDDEKIDCDFKLVGRFAGALSERQYDALARDSDYLSKTLGIEAFPVPASSMHNHIATELYKGGGVRMDIGGLHPGKLHAAMLRLARAAGAVVIGGTAVQGVVPDGTLHQIATVRGTVRAREVISATNGYTDRSDQWLQRRIVPIRSRIIVTETLPPGLIDQLLPSRMMISDKRKLTYYFRPTPDGSRLLFGGRDGTFSGDPAWPTRHLETEMTRIFPALAGIGLSHSWFGQVAMNRDMMPRIFQKNGIHYATGCCGSGVVWLRWAGIMVANKILGSEIPSSLDFDPPRSIPFFKGTAWFMPAVFAAMKVQDKFSLR